MQVQYKLFVDGGRGLFKGDKRSPMQSGVVQSKDLRSFMNEHVQAAHVDNVLRELSQGVKVDYTNRRKGFNLVLTNLNKKTKIKRERSSGFLRVKLDGVQTEAQIKVAAADKLKGKDGYHRTVCLVEANGLEYKVKCAHKDLSYTNTVHQCKVVSKKVI